MNANRNIAAFLIICFSAFLGHNLVPHHHHSRVFHTPVVSDCSYKHGDHHGHEQDGVNEPDTEKQSRHCHAFNDVVFPKYSAPSLPPGTFSLPAMMVPGHSYLPEGDQHLSPYPCFVLKAPHIPMVFLGSRSLRAPPVFA